MTVAQIIGRTAADRVRIELTKPGPAPASRRSVLVRTLDRDEVRELVRSVEALTVDGSDRTVEIVVSMSAARRSEDQGLAPFASDHPLTYFRSRASRGLVLIELDPFSDAAGQRHLRTISDRDLLGGLDDRRSRDMLLKHAWEAVRSPQDPPPHVLTERLEDLARAFLATEVALRPWAAFVAHVLSNLSSDEVVTGENAEALISEALPVLGLFKDPELFGHRNLARELGQNRHLAQLRDPAGRELEQEDWLRRIEAATFAAQDEARDSAREEERRASARAYVLARTTDNRRAAPTYREWTRIFEARAKRGLGEQIRAELERLNSTALEHFDELALAGDLDDRDREAAMRLAEDDEDVGEGKSLLELMPAVLRRRVERLAEPGTTVVDEPLRGLLRAVMSLAAEDGAEIVVRPLGPESPAGTLHLFALIYGPTLAAVAQGSRGRLTISDDLLRVGRLPTVSPVDPDDIAESEDAREHWADLRLEVSTRDGESGLNLAWAPQRRDGLALFARIIGSEEQSAWPLEADDFQSLLNDALSFGPISPDPSDEPSDALRTWLEVRSRFLADFRSRGLASDELAAYATAWESHAAQLIDSVRARPELREELVGPFLDVDLASAAGGAELWMLSSHPLRLRWLGRDLDELRRHLVAALEGRLELNPENSTLFFDWLERVSPHRQPPMLCSNDRTYLPAQELALHEQYVRTEVNRSSVGEQMDVKTASEVTSIVANYLEAFPSKVDRFVLLVLTQAGDSQLVEQVIHRLLVDRKTSVALQSVELHLVAPVEHHRRLAGAIARLRVESTSARLFPRLRTLLHIWPENGLPPLDELADDVDIAVVPEVLGSSATLNDSTGAPARTAMKFDPWMDKPVHVPLASRHRTDVTIELLPNAADAPLEHWSTLNVWRRRQPVGGDPGDVDRVSLAVDVRRGLELFQRLHDVAQWVVTVDEFVGREQIDAIQDPPDVILVRPGRGKNEQYTLVVSSRAGRAFVERGLTRKLSRLDLDLDQAGAAALSKRLYDLARNTAPSVVLRAVGLGRTLEEILGLVTTRVLVELALPSADGVGADWWISLDDHTEWFGGALKSRADLARVSLRRSDGHARVVVDVVESKFRKSDDSQQAVRQVARTMRVLKAGLDIEEQRADSLFWREEIARAIDGVSRRPAGSDDLPGFLAVGGADDAVLDTLRSQLRDGTYDMTIRGVVCAIAVTSQAQLQRTDENGITVLRVPGPTASAVLRGLVSSEGLPDFPELRPAPVNSEPATTDRRPDGQSHERNASDGRTSLDDDKSSDSVVHPIEHAGGEAGEAGEASAASTDATSMTGERGGDYRRGRLSEAVLRSRLQIVVDKLDELRVPVDVPSSEPFDEGPGFYLLRVAPGHGVKVQQIQQRTEDLELALGLERDQALRTYTHRGAVVLEVPKQDSERYSVDAAQLWARVPIDPTRLIVPIGEDIRGDPVTLDFSSPDSPHLLVAGMTGFREVGRTGDSPAWRLPIPAGGIANSRRRSQANRAHLPRGRCSAPG